MRKGVKVLKNNNFNQNRLWILFITPLFSYLLIAQIYPLFSVLRMSFFIDRLGESVFVGLKNYIDLFNTKKFWDIFRNTFVFTVASVSLHILVGLTIAVLLSEEIKFKRLLRALQLVPWLFPPVVACIFWLLLYQQQLGLINKFLLLVGLSRFTYEWLGNPTTAMLAVIICNVWVGYAFFALMLNVSIQLIPKSLYEAAEIDGASKWTCFTRITLPFLKPIILTLSVLDAIWSYRVFDQVFILTRGGPVHFTELLSVYTYKTAFNEFNFNKAAAIGGCSLIMLMIFAFIYLKIYSRSDEI